VTVAAAAPLLAAAAAAAGAGVGAGAAAAASALALAFLAAFLLVASLMFAMVLDGKLDGLIGVNELTQHK